MPQYATDFSEYGEGLQPGDWTSWWNDPGEWKITSLDFGINPTYAPALHKDNTAGAGAAACTWDDVGAAPPGDIDRIGIWSARNSALAVGPIFRVSGGIGSENGYAVSLNTNLQFRLERYAAGVRTTPATAAHVIDDLVLYWVRAQLLIEGPNVRIRARIWALDEDEPAGWDIDYVDAAPLANGPLGMWQNTNGDGNYCYQEGIGTDGDPAIGSTEGSFPGVGDPPTLRIGNVGDDAALFSVDTLSSYLEVQFRAYQSVTRIANVLQTGPNRFFYTLTGLAASTDYVAWARVRRAAGWSPWTYVNFTTLAANLEDVFLSCPPSWTGIHVNADANPPDNRYGIGWLRPQPGEPMRDTVELVLRWPTSGPRWNFQLSADNGVTWPVTLASNVTASGADGDNLIQYRAFWDTTAVADGQNYRLRAVDADGVEDPVVSLSFLVDNAEEAHWWKQTYAELGNRFGKMWAQQGSDTLGRVNGQEIWVRGPDGGIGAVAGHDWAVFADLEVPTARGFDVTLKMYVWSGEGGWLQLQGRDDTEAIWGGIALLAKGLTSGGREGIFIGLENPLTYPADCCASYLTSAQADLILYGNLNPGDPMTPSAYGNERVEALPLVFFKAMRLPKWHGLTTENLLKWPIMSWREGPDVGDDIRFQRQTCARRYEQYVIRARIEPHPTNNHLLRLQARIDGLGITEPTGSYWHIDSWLDRGEPWQEGAVGLCSKQLAQSAYGTASGARVFLAWSAIPLEDVYDTPDVPPFEPEWWNPPREGEPCTVILQHFDEDRKRVLWEVGTDPNHENPYLLSPASYGEQEIDVVEGAATIGQVEAVVVDRGERIGDQDSGWMTKRLPVSGGAVGGIHGRRQRMLRYIDYDLGWVVLADGPASTPRMDEEYAAYRWMIRDTRETERKVRAFVRADTSWLLPMGVEPGFGAYVDEDGNDQWLISPATPLTATYVFDAADPFPTGYVNLSAYWPGPFGPTGQPLGTQTVPEIIVITDAVEKQFIADAEELGDPRPVLWTWPDLEVLWRVNGSGDDWTVVQPSDMLVEGRNLAKPSGAGQWWRSLIGTAWDAELADGTECRAVLTLLIRGYLASGSYPTNGQTIDVAVRYVGEPSEDFPLHLEGMTPGALAKDVYDGVYSDPDPVTGDPIPSGIIYDEQDLLATGYGYRAPGTGIPAGASPQATVLVRITEKVDDARAWLEKHIFAPLGDCPALDNDAEISPVSQIPPETADGLIHITNAITEPQPDWDAGERIINILRYEYPRWFQRTLSDALNGSVTSIDRLESRDVIFEFRDEASITRHGEQVAEFEGDAFAAVGDDYGKPMVRVEAEAGYLLAGYRRLYVFDRYRNGAPTISVPVRRDVVHSLRPGDWVVPDLSWFPDYVEQDIPED